MSQAQSIINEPGRPADGKTILAQLGIDTRMRIGAHSTIVNLGDGIMFFVSGRKRKVIIKLNDSDLYDVEIGRIVDVVDWKVDGVERDVYAEDLSSTVERLCGERS